MSWLLAATAMLGTMAQLLSQAPPVPGDLVSISPREIEINDGETVEFTVELKSRFASRNLTVLIDFGDRTPPVQWDRRNPVAHTFNSRNDTRYLARVIVRTGSGGETRTVGESNPSVVVVRAKPTPPTLRLAVSASPNPAFTGEPVKFAVGTQGFTHEDGTPIFVGFTFGDGAGQRRFDINAIEHAYKDPGAFTATATLGEINGTGSTSVEVLPAPTVSLQVPKEPVKAGKSGRFEAFVEPRTPNLGYRFVFNDGSGPQFSSDGVTDHRFNLAGRFRARVDVGRLVKTASGPDIEHVLARSSDREILVAEPPRLLLNPTAITVKKREHVVFEISLSDGSPVGAFDFYPARGAPPTPINGTRFSHTYPEPGDYVARVERDGQDAMAMIKVLSPWPPVWAWITGGALLIGAGAAGFAKMRNLPPFRPHFLVRHKPDTNPSLRAGRRSPGVGLSMRVRRHLQSLRCTIRTTGGRPLIQSRRKPNE